MTDLPPDPVLRALGTTARSRLGSGGEAWVYALDTERVARIHVAGTPEELPARRAALLRELEEGAHAVPFELPRVLEVTNVGGWAVTIETRLRGRPLAQELANLSDAAERESLIRVYLDAVARLGDLPLSRPFFGDLVVPDPIRCATFRAYLAQRAARNLAAAGEAFAAVDPEALAAAWPEPRQIGFVHLDAFAGNVLAEAGRITAVVDLASVSLVGDPRLDPLTAAAYLAPEITPTAVARDRGVAREWLAERGLSELFEPARRWVAAYWSFAPVTSSLHRWCRRVLLG